MSKILESVCSTAAAVIIGTIDVDHKLSLLDASTFGLLRVFRSKLKLPRKTPVG